MCLRWSRRPQPGTPRNDGIRTAPHPRVPPSSPKPPQSLPYPPHPERAPPPPPPPPPPSPPSPPPLLENDSSADSEDEDKVLELYSVLCGPMTRNRAKPQPLLRPPSGPIHRESTLAFRFQIGKGTFFKMPEEISQYEEILSARGFTLHHEYFVDETMARLLIARDFQSPLAMYSNYRGKPVSWYLIHKRSPRWFFSFLDSRGVVVEYAQYFVRDTDKMWTWGTHIELAAWMAGIITSREGITIC